MLGEHRPPAVAVGMTAGAGGAVPAGSADGGPAAGRSAWRDPVAWAIAACVFGAYFTISLFRLIKLAPTSWDLGIYTEYVKQLAHLHAPIVDVRGPGFNLLGDHFQVAVGVIAPFFRLFPTPATLLFFQAAFAAVSVFPVVAAGSALIGRPAARLVGLAYGFSWGLQQMIVFDFHEIAIAVPLLAFSLSALVRGRVRAAAVWALPLVFVKEDQGFTVAAIGALLLWYGTRPREDRVRGDAAWGTFLVVWGMSWSVLAITVIIPHFNPVHEYYYWKDGGVIGNGAPLSVTGLIRQTAYGWPVKLQTVVLLLLPTAFAAAGSPVALVALPGMALRFISTNTAYWGTDWHYNATVMPVLFIAAIEAIGRWRALPDMPGAAAPRHIRTFRENKRSIANTLRTALARHAAPMMVAVAVALAFQFPLHELWHGSTYSVIPHVAADDAAMAVVPDGATVTTTLNMLAPLAARTDTYWIGNAGNPPTQYIVFDGDASGYDPPPTNVPALIAQLYPKTRYVQVFDQDNVYVFRRQA